MTAAVVRLEAAAGKNAGGKAEGLARLIEYGFSVPPGFVVLDPEHASREEIEVAYGAIGEGPVAVRSSAADEDGELASFAGQHETFLSIVGVDALIDAVARCVASLDSAHANAYRSAHGATPARMSVVVQRMVDARAAGVSFSADPVTGRRDRVVVDAVAGLGDALVSGRLTPDHHVFARGGALAMRDGAGEEPVLTEREALEVARLTERVADAFGRPMDVEWAYADDGRLLLLQARPITRLGADPRELDTLHEPDHLLTRCNIGEMMPGAATPLTWSTSARGIDDGMQRLYAEIGVLPERRHSTVYVKQSFGQLFLDLTELMRIGRCVLGASEEDVAAAICGRVIEAQPTGPRPSFLERLRNGIRYARAIRSAGARLADLDRLLAGTAFEDAGDAKSRYAALDRALPALMEAYYHHLVASLQSGALATALLRVVSGGGPVETAHHAEVASLLADATGVESHDIARAIEDLGRTWARLDPGLTDRASSMSREEVRRELQRASAEVREGYAAYLARHGHRCVREVELREPEWSHDDGPILDALRGALAAPVRSRRNAHEVPWRLRPMVRMAHDGVRWREAAKSKLVMLSTRFKRAYRSLGRVLVEEGRLPDADLVYFLTHGELGQLLSGQASLAGLATERRSIHGAQGRIRFADVCLGAPEPETAIVVSGDGVLRGKPVSRGRVRGFARVALTLDDARDVRPGEILIAPITDVGWTPCFGVIAGLATDIGSAVSHGAVVAREFGLPAVVDLRAATAAFRTGDFVELDADEGVLRRIPRDDDGTSESDESRSVS